MEEERHFKQDNENYVMLGTKTRKDFAETFNRICKKKGIKVYNAIQMMVDTFVRFTDDRHNLSVEMERLMSVFEHMDGWKDAFNLADPTPDRDIQEALYFITGTDRKGARGVMVHRPFFGNWTETVNIQYIIERVLEVMCPERYRRLRALAVEMDCNSILDLLDEMINNHTSELMNDQFRQGFADNNRHYGKPVEYGQRTKRKHHKSVDDIQTHLAFEEPVTPEEMENEAGFQPIGGEW